MGKFEFNKKLDNISPYVVDKTRYAIKLDANESFITFPDYIESQIVQAIRNLAFNRYPDADSEELCNLYAEYSGAPKDNIIAGNGSDELIQIVINAFLEKDDKILTLTPDFSMYKFYTSIIGGNVIEFQLEETQDKMSLDIDKFIETANKEEVKLVIFSNPNNPTGGIIPKEDIKKIIEECNAIVVVDEAYYEFYGNSALDLISEYNNLIILRTCSKAMGLAAARLGFLIANKAVVNNVKKVKPPFNVNSLTQAVGSVLLSNQDFIEKSVKGIIREKEYLLGRLRNLVKDSLMFDTHTNFVYIRFKNPVKVYRELLNKGISIRYFKSSMTRITIGNRKENEALIEALEEIL